MNGFPGVQPGVYLDHAASTPLDPVVLEAMLPWLQGGVGNPSSIHRHGRQLRAAIEKARKTIAEVLGASPSEIVFTSGGTEADNLALRSAAALTGARTYISCPTEHHAVTHTLECLAEHTGARLVWLGVTPEGRIDLAELEAALHAAADDARRHGVATSALVSLMHANNETGTLHPLAEIAALCQAYGAVYHSDTVQTLGLMPVQVNAVPVDLIVGAAHKFYGPRGAGFLYRSPRVVLPPQITGGGQERNVRAGTENVAGIVGLAVALERAATHAADHRHHLQTLKTYFLTNLQAAIPGIRLNGCADPVLAMPSVANVAFPGTDPEALLLYHFDLHGVSVSGGSACTSGSAVPSHVLSAMGFDAVHIAHSLRFSFGVPTTEADLDRAIEVARLAFPVAATA